MKSNITPALLNTVKNGRKSDIVEWCKRVTFEYKNPSTKTITT